MIRLQVARKAHLPHNGASKSLKIIFHITNYCHNGLTESSLETFFKRAKTHTRSWTKTSLQYFLKTNPVSLATVIKFNHVLIPNQMKEIRIKWVLWTWYSTSKQWTHTSQSKRTWTKWSRSWTNPRPINLFYRKKTLLKRGK